MTELEETTKFDKYIFCLVLIYRCKTNRFIHHKKELIETCEYMDFDIGVNKKLVQLKVELINPHILCLFDKIKPIMITIREMNIYKLIVPATYCFYF